MLSDKNHKRNQTVTGASVVEEPVTVMHIAVCDDEELCIEELKQIFEKVKIAVTLRVEYYTTAEALLAELSARHKNKEALLDVIFCDVRMPGTDGITFGKKIRELSRNIFLILFTAFPEYAIQGYEAHAFRYLLKPVAVPDIERVLCAILQEKSKCKKLFVRTAEGEYVRELSEFTYLSSEDKYTILYTKEAHYVDRMSLNDYEQLLEPYGFCRIHRKYLVNLAQHKNMTRGKVFLLDGTELPISRRKETVYRDRLVQMLGEELL